MADLAGGGPERLWVDAPHAAGDWAQRLSGVRVLRSEGTRTLLALEPGSDDQIKAFCSSKYSVTFPMMSKISVKGDDIAPLYKYLTTASGDFAGDIEWNFNKFLVDRNGNVIARYPSPTKPEDAKVTSAVEKALAAKPAK